jgi:hypothetical protein
MSEEAGDGLVHKPEGRSFVLRDFTDLDGQDILTW